MRALLKRRIPRFLFRLFVFLLVLQFTGCAVLYWEQDALIFPGSAFQGRPQAKIIAPPGCEIVHLTTPAGDHIAALYGKALLPNDKVDPDADKRLTFLYFYGNGAVVAFSMGEFKMFRRLDVNVLMPDYVGYGDSTGRPSEKNLYATADAAYAYLISHRGARADRIVSVGWSLGAAVAIDLADRQPVAGLMTFNAFTTLLEMAQKVAPYTNADKILKYKFDNLTKIKSVACPTFICNGTRDDLVPPEMSERLARAAKGRVFRVQIIGAMHNDIMFYDQDTLVPAMKRFLGPIDRQDAEAPR